MIRDVARRSAYVAAVLVANLVLAAGAVDAVTSTEGKDYSYDYSGGTRMAVCDREADSHKVYTKWVFTDGGTGKWSDVDGSNGNCSRTPPYSNKIRQHKTCEQRHPWIDKCGNTEGTGY